MAIKLTKDEAKDRDRWVETLQKASANLHEAVDEYNAKAQTLHASLEDAIDVYNTGIQEARDALALAAEAYNHTLAEIKDFAEGVKDRCQVEWDARSAKWQDGERGTAAQQFIDAWEELEGELDEVDFDEHEVEVPEADELEAPKDLSPKLADLPEEPGG